MSFSAIELLSQQCHRIAKEKGWWGEYDVNDTGTLVLTADAILAKLMLVVTELSEGVEEVRSPNFDPHLIYPKGQPGVPYDEATHGAGPSPLKPEGFAVEAMDALIRILDLCEAMGLDVHRAYTLKTRYNETRAHRHGGKRA